MSAALAEYPAPCFALVISGAKKKKVPPESEECRWSKLANDIGSQAPLTHRIHKVSSDMFVVEEAGDPKVGQLGDLVTSVPHDVLRLPWRTGRDQARASERKASILIFSP